MALEEISQDCFLLYPFTTLSLYPFSLFADTDTVTDTFLGSEGRCLFLCN